MLAQTRTIERYLAVHLGLQLTHRLAQVETPRSVTMSKEEASAPVAKTKGLHGAQRSGSHTGVDAVGAEENSEEGEANEKN